MDEITTMHVIGSRQFGGAERFFLRLVSALRDAGHPTVAVARRDTPIAEALDRLGGRNHFLSFANSWDFATRGALRGLLRYYRPAVVQTYMGRATRLMRKPRGLPSFHVARLGGYYRIDGYYRHCDAWIGNTRGLHRYLLEQGLPPARCKMIGNFVAPASRPAPSDRIALRHRYGIPADATLLVAVGRMIEKKGFQDLLPAVAMLCGEFRGLHLLLVGDGPSRPELEAKARDLGIAERVHWAGWQTDPDAHYACSDVFVCPSRHEPLGNVILEAWSHGLPLVSTRSDGAAELVRDGESGILCDPGSPGALAAGIRQMLEMPREARERLGRAGLDALRREHSQEAVTNRYLAFYRELTQGVAVAH